MATAIVRPKEFNCFDCKFYRPDETREFQGNCCRYHAVNESGVGPGEPGMEHCFIQEPIDCWCGDFQKWTGTPREQGRCPYVAPTTVAEAAEVTPETKAAADTQAAKATTTKATTKKGGK